MIIDSIFLIGLIGPLIFCLDYSYPIVAHLFKFIRLATEWPSYAWSDLS